MVDDRAIARVDLRPYEVLDAQGAGGDAGASEVIVLRAYGPTASDEEGLVTSLLLPDAPVVVWWPSGGAVGLAIVRDIALLSDLVSGLAATGAWHELLGHRGELSAPPHE